MGGKLACVRSDVKGPVRAEKVNCRGRVAVPHYLHEVTSAQARRGHFSGKVIAELWPVWLCAL